MEPISGPAGGRDCSALTMGPPFHTLLARLAGITRQFQFTAVKDAPPAGAAPASKKRKKGGFGCCSGAACMACSHWLPSPPHSAAPSRRPTACSPRTAAGPFQCQGHVGPPDHHPEPGRRAWPGRRPRRHRHGPPPGGAAAAAAGGCGCGWRQVSQAHAGGAGAARRCRPEAAEGRGCSDQAWRRSGWRSWRPQGGDTG